jgi:uncharacterized protein YjiK
MPSHNGLPPAELRASIPRKERAELPFGPAAKVTQVLPADSKVVKEPSGIVFHPGRGTLFVVGDRGDVAELTSNGKVLRRANIDGHNFEGVTVGPNDRIFAIEEKKTPIIYELDPDSLKVKAQYEVDTKLHGQRIIGNEHNKSTEGLCYVPEQNAFYCVNQQPPRLVRLDVPLDKKDGKAKAKDVIELSDILQHQASDITYDRASGHFLITESSGGKGEGSVYELTVDGQLVSKTSIPGKRAEGLALDGSGRAFIADDAGGVLRVDP